MAKVKERDERKRLAEYSLTPRWEFAFGTWGVGEIRWKFDGELKVTKCETTADGLGRFTPVAIKTILTNLFSALDDTYPSTSHKVHRDMPSLLTFSPVPMALFDELKSLSTSDFDRLAEHLGDVAFVSTDSARFARLFDGDAEPEARYRAEKRLRAEAMLLRNGLAQIVHTDQLALPSSDKEADGLAAPANKQVLETSPSQSFMSLSNDETDTGSDDDEAQTPPMESSIHMPGGGMEGGKAAQGLGMEFGKMHIAGGGESGRVSRRMSEQAF